MKRILPLKPHIRDVAQQIVLTVGSLMLLNHVKGISTVLVKKCS
jgi:hypothetical protein